MHFFITLSFKVSIAFAFKMWGSISFPKHMAANDGGGGCDSTWQWVCQALNFIIEIQIQQPQS